MQQTSDKKESARAAYQDFVQRQFDIEFGKVSSDVQRSLYLTQFYIREIHNATRTSISDDDIEDGLTDGSNDLGADFIYRDDEQVFIFQSKYHGKGVAVALHEVQHFQNVLRRLRNPTWKRNSRVKELLSEVDWNKDTFQLKFIALGAIEGQARKQCDEPLGLPDDVPGLVDRVNIEYYGEAQLNDELRNALSQSTGIPGEISLVSSGERKKSDRNSRNPIRRTSVIRSHRRCESDRGNASKGP
jgi:hypothetical protein